MSLFLTEEERARIESARKTSPVRDFYWSLLNRVDGRIANPGLIDKDTTVDWWHLIAEYLTDAAMAWALKPGKHLEVWLRDTTLSVARRPVDDWVGPDFRNHSIEPPQGNLETGHIALALAVVLDLAGDIFSQEERDEIASALEEKGMALCRRWLDNQNSLTNWRCILLMGYSVPAAVLNDVDALDYAAKAFAQCVDLFQPDGSYGESLQYGNYAMTGLVHTREALVRRRPELDDSLPLAPYCFKPRWDAASFFYAKPLSGWGAHPRPRCANFGDSAAIYQPSADNLLHIAVRDRKRHPEAAGLARWLFDRDYLPCIERTPHDRASFGFVNHFGFLTLPLLPQAAPPVTPEDAGLSNLETFSCGNVLARHRWGGRTVLAARTGGEPLHAVAHLHGDLNSFILVHNEERLLADPGHACYRNLIHELETSTLSHNTCTFTVEEPSEVTTPRIQQGKDGRRKLNAEGQPDAPVDHGARLLLAERQGDVTAIASEAARLYGPPIGRFTRLWLLCDEHVLFVVDFILAYEPVKTTWSWLLNNRDDGLHLKLVRPDRLVARRGNAGMKLFHLGGGDMQTPLNGYIHDAYHPLPNQLGEGKPGSGLLLRWEEKAATTKSATVHAICLDTPGSIAGWHLKKEEGFAAVIECPEGVRHWKLALTEDNLGASILESHTGVTTHVSADQGTWKLYSES